MAITQFQPVPGIIDLAWGHPDPDLLPIRELRTAAERAMDRYGPDLLAYGNAAGPPPLIDFICDRLRLTDARAPGSAEVVITSGASQGLDLVATLLLAPGDAVLIDVPTYHLAARILRDHPVELVGVASDADGIVLDDLARVLSQFRHGRQRPKFLYTIATFHNPTGRSLPDQRRAELLAIAAREELLIVEDDTYRELSYDGPAPASLWALDASESVIRLGSFAKSVAPGLRVGYVTASAAIAARMADGGLLDSGGGISHFAATVLAEYAAAGDYARQVERFRAAYRERRDRTGGGLRQFLQDEDVALFGVGRPVLQELARWSPTSPEASSRPCTPRTMARRTTRPPRGPWRGPPGDVGCASVGASRWSGSSAPRGASPRS